MPSLRRSCTHRLPAVFLMLRLRSTFPCIFLGSPRFHYHASVNHSSHVPLNNSVRNKR
ncbi:hypothetical protein BGW80DRAFT_1419281 [Lactifluus volemus]|nr:hypothetical protein BGW80DRAFT_1419281 [Lactifluus volemus]